MPVAVKDIQGSMAPIDERVLDLLGANPQKAYSVVEIFLALEGYPEVHWPSWELIVEMKDELRARVGEVEHVVKDLVARKKAQQGKRMGAIYYFAASQ